MEVFGSYLSKIENEAHRTRMREVLEWVKNQPMFTDHGTFIIAFSASKQHFSVAPEQAAIEKFSAEINKSGYSQSSNIFRIRWEEPVEFSLLEQIIQYNLKEKADCDSFWRK